MNLYNLPWPKEALMDLEETAVKMRITLSYFIEPGPGEIGWKDRYRYASHGLRFAINGPQESENEFIYRINKQARDGDDAPPETIGPNDKWLFGEAKNAGSIHSDIWSGTASDLATSNLVAIYPTVGWWRERHHLKRVQRQTRYSLLVSIYPPTESIDIYTPVMQQISVPIEVSGRRI